MGVEGSLLIRLRTIEGAARAVHITSSRPLYASSVLNGRPVREAQAMIPLLYSVCGTAQACAGARACEQAMGLKMPTRVEAMRDALVGMETLREHFWRVFLGWPVFLNETVDSASMAEVISIQAEYRRAFQAQAALLTPSGAERESRATDLRAVRDRLYTMQRHAVFASEAEEWLELSTLDDLLAWAASGETLAARMLSRVAAEAWSDAGVCECAPMPELDAVGLRRAMRDPEFISRPSWDGECRETSALTRVDSPLLNVLKCQYGNGLLVRLVARLTEIARLLATLFAPLPCGDESVETGERAESGIGQAEAARGRLLHCVELRDGKVRDYRVLAPTEWNFHPQGVVARALSALKGTPTQMEHQARLLIDAIDPCVGYELNIVEA